MSFFVGTYEVAVDPKHRVPIPFAVRSKMNTERDGRSFYVLPGKRSGTLALYPERHFERLREQEPDDDRLSGDAFEFRQWEFSQCALLDPDSQGRIVIPERLLKRAGIEREASLIGVRDHLELWPREAFDAFEAGKWPSYPEQRRRVQSELNSRGASDGGSTVDTNGN